MKSSFSITAYEYNVIRDQHFHAYVMLLIGLSWRISHVVIAVHCVSGGLTLHISLFQVLAVSIQSSPTRTYFTSMLFLHSSYLIYNCVLKIQVCPNEYICTVVTYTLYPCDQYALFVQYFTFESGICYVCLDVLLNGNAYNILYSIILLSCKIVKTIRCE